MSGRAFLIVLDSVGIGGAPDADAFGDEGADTLGHIAASAGLSTPVLDGLGLRHAHALANGRPVPGAPAHGRWGAATEASMGKDTPSGHWELAGLPVPFDWTVFPDADPAFPPEVMAAVADAAGADGTLCNARASGTEVIARLGAEHLATGRPILYTSADSVVQIAAHEEAFGLERLLDTCRAVAPDLHARKVGRVIARPFTGPEGAFERTANRRDFALEPPGETLLDIAHGAGREVIAVGKISDIFAGRGVTRALKGRDAALMGHLDALAAEAPEGALVFANLVEFDSEYGHRRDPEGYAAALGRFDGWLGAFLPRLRAGDLCAITADHGNDPTWRGTDHTRERVPVLIHGAGEGPLGHLAFADVGASVAAWLGLPPPPHGRNAL
ncbi:MAG: phosphopentomutase [Hasllibacter sp.]